MDVLGDVLKIIKLKSAVYFQSDFPATWGMDVGQSPFAQFHMIVRGYCHLTLGEEEISLNAGDLVVFPFGAPHTVVGRLGNRVLDGKEVVQSVVSGEQPFYGEGSHTRMICGHFEMEQGMDHPLINGLPNLIHIKDEERREARWLEGITNSIIKETGNDDPGAEVIVSKLAEVLFIHVLRTYAKSLTNESGFLSALYDDRIGKVLQLIHSDIQREWTLEGLSREIGVSRTLLANRFRELVGEPPIQYLSDLRMTKASELLRVPDYSLLEVAELVGYGSEAAFIRTFKRKFGTTPGAFRRSV